MYIHIYICMYIYAHHIRSLKSFLYIGNSNKNVSTKTLKISTMYIYIVFALHLAVLRNVYIYIYIYAMTPPLSTPLAPDNCRRIHLWPVQGFLLGSPPVGRKLRRGLLTWS